MEAVFVTTSWTLVGATAGAVYAGAVVRAPTVREAGAAASVGMLAVGIAAAPVPLVAVPLSSSADAKLVKWDVVAGEHQNVGTICDEAQHYTKPLNNHRANSASWRAILFKS
jgi:hypothetical protein